MSTISEQIMDGRRPDVKDKHAVVYYDDKACCWRVGFVADYDNAKDTARRWKESMGQHKAAGRIMICKLVETIEWS